jgi:hypothetical protein
MLLIRPWYSLLVMAKFDTKKCNIVPIYLLKSGLFPPFNCAGSDGNAIRCLFRVSTGIVRDIMIDYKQERV